MSRRVALPAHCSQCGSVVLTGPDNDACAFTATVDPYAADIVAETLALLSGRSTYDAHRVKGRVELEARDRFSVENPRGLVVLAHDCQAPHRDGECVIETPAATTDLFTHDDERVPF